MCILATIYQSSAFGPFIGVLLGFAVNYSYQSYKNNEDKNKYKSMIRSELEMCISILEETEIRLLPMNNWISAINSGALKLFDVKSELEPLNTIYNTIREHNNDTPIGVPWKDEVYLQKKRILLLANLKNLESEKWLEPKSWWQ